jgi:hypothetical protein
MIHKLRNRLIVVHVGVLCSPEEVNTNMLLHFARKGTMVLLCNLQHSLLDTGGGIEKHSKVVGRRTFWIVTFSQQLERVISKYIPHNAA